MHYWSVSATERCQIERELRKMTSQLAQPIVLQAQIYAKGPDMNLWPFYVTPFIMIAGYAFD